MFHRKDIEAPKAAPWVASDHQDGDHSVNEIVKKHEANEAAQAAANRATWHQSPSLSAAEIKLLDGVNGGNYERRWDSTPRNEIGHPKAIASKQPSGYTTAEPDQTLPGDSEPRSLKPGQASKNSVADVRDSKVKGA